MITTTDIQPSPVQSWTKTRPSVAERKRLRGQVSLEEEVKIVKKTYEAPRLAVYGKLDEITLGVGGTAPDIPGIPNNICATGTVVNTSGSTVTITCASTSG